MGGEDHTGNFWGTPYAKTQLPNNLEGREKDQIREEEGGSWWGGTQRRRGRRREDEKSDGFACGVLMFNGSDF